MPGNNTVKLPDGSTVTYNMQGAEVGRTAATPTTTQNAQSAFQPTAGSGGASGASSGAVGGLTQAGAGSSYTVGPSGQASYTVTPNLIPQQAAAQQEQTKLSGSIESGQQATAQAAAEKSQASAQAATAGLASQQAAAEQALVGQKAGLSEAGFTSRLNQLQPFMGPQAQVGMGGVAGSNGMSSQETAARAASFARAKEQAGQNALGGLKAVQGLVENKGMMGSTYEAGLMGDVLGGASGNVNDFTREQLIQDLNRSAGIADMTYQGNITQRGQDLQRQMALMGLLNSGPMY